MFLVSQHQLGYFNSPGIDWARPLNRGAALNRGLVAWWHPEAAPGKGFPYPSDRRLWDLFPSANHGTLLVSAKWGSLAGRRGLLLDAGSTSCVDIPSLLSAHALITAWFCTSTVTRQSIIGTGSNNLGGILVTGASQITAGNNSSEVDFATPYPIADGTWHFVVVEFAGTTIRRMWLDDGIDLGSLTCSISNGTVVNRIGGKATQFFVGCLGDIRMQNCTSGAPSAFLMSPPTVGWVKALYRASRFNYEHEINWQQTPVTIASGGASRSASYSPFRSPHFAES